MLKVFLLSFYYVSLLRKDCDVIKSSFFSCFDCEGTFWKCIVSNGRNVVVCCGCLVIDFYELIMVIFGVPS